MRDERPTTRARPAAIALAAVALAWSACDAGPEPARERRAELEALGYVDRHVADEPAKRGVTVGAPSDPRALFLYTSRPRKSAHLIDARGRVVHTWQHRESADAWQHVEMLAGGDLLVVVKDRELTRLSWDSDVLWNARLAVHHDLDVARDGSVYALARRRRRVQRAGAELPVVDDLIVQLSPDGDMLRELSIHDALGSLVPDEAHEALADEVTRSSPDEVEALGPDSPADLYHTNSIQLVAWNGSPDEAVALLSVRSISSVVALHLDTGEVLWKWGPGILSEQHDATLNANGRITIFDNGVAGGASRIVEVDPGADTYDVLYRAPDFYSDRRGGVQRLPGGRLLIAESNRGRAFEVDAGGQILWEFWNPDVEELEHGEPGRAALYRFTRVDPERLPKLDLSAPASP